MKRLILFATLLTPPTFAAETKVKLGSLPPAVQASVNEQTKNAELVGLSKETEKGKTVYEVETRVNGKTRDMLMDKTGAVIEVEEEVDIDSIPAPAKAAIVKKAGAGTVQMVEKLTAGASISYEGHVKTKAGKMTEVGVNADGSVHKE